jgi:hypothetical protein
MHKNEHGDGFDHLCMRCYKIASSRDMTHTMKKTLYLTLDYELFFGNATGSVFDTMINPTNKLLKLLKPIEGKVTIFWDICHFVCAKNYYSTFPELVQDNQLIEAQLISLLVSGHDLQFHFHPHWIYSTYENGWICNKSYYSPENFKTKNEKAMLREVFQSCVREIEEIYAKSKRKWGVRIYRAGGWQIEPFELIKEMLEVSQIFIDSSVMPGAMRNEPPITYRFDSKNHVPYKFSNAVNISDPDGHFTEIPINQVQYNTFHKLLFKVINLIQYGGRYLETISAGSTIVSDNNKNKFLVNIKQSKIPISVENQSFLLSNYGIVDIPNNCISISHPKSINEMNIFQFKKYIYDHNVSVEPLINHYALNR